MRYIPSGPYVYALADDMGDVFYIGKGRNGRMYSHESMARRGKPGDRLDRIREVIGRGGEVQCIVLGEYDNDSDALAAEVMYIATHTELTNKTKGGEKGGGKPVPAVDRIIADAKVRLARLAKMGIVSGDAIDELRRQSVSPDPNMVTFIPGVGAIFGHHFDKPIIHQISAQP